MEYIIFCIAVGIVMLILFISGIIDNRKKKRLFIAKLKSQYGTFDQKKYKPEQYNSIARYFRTHRNKSDTEGRVSIDDITWNDLEIDRLFKMMNITYSSAGEEYLYYVLRTPMHNLQDLQELEKIVQYFDAHEEDRITFQLICKKLGKTGNYSIFDYLTYLDTLGERKNFKHIIMDILFLPAIMSIYYNTAVGIFALLLLFCINIVTYFKEKEKIAPYITSFMYVMRLLNSVDELRKVPIKGIRKYEDILLQKRNRFKKFKRFSHLVMSDANTSGNPLELLFDYIKMIFHIDIIKFNSMLCELKTHMDDVDSMVSTIGYLETAIAIANYRHALQYYCIPQFEQQIAIDAKDIYHPYITDPIANSIYAKKGILLTGSNASGKSTFLKTIALNAITAQTIHTAAAHTFQTTFFSIYSSMSLRDDLTSGESYYMVEIRALKRILDAALHVEKPILCFVDEVLRGTNTVERIAASTQILKSLATKNVLCFAATHDIELTNLLNNSYDNYHFTENIVDGDVLFDYQLLQGYATTKNAIKLLETIGYESDIIETANELAEGFLKTGKWKENL